ncbi:Uncharacterized protein YwrF [Madurella mycetomatis]|uniref:Uncharacterized protein YwrF n=1 Tax=Madurella mycetomatis TaxID=100816 RepID=A0A175WJB5_9PEZI|nr:Uncharacterized protein YwrF [Madurella mycetomatis]
MLYIPGKTPHNLPFDPFKACVVPRPIGWISTTSSTDSDDNNINGDTNPPTHNLAPFSQFCPLNFDPPLILFSANQTPGGRQKDTVRNVEATGKFAFNLATYALREQVNITAEQVAPDVDEFVRAGLDKDFTTLLPGDDVNPVPMVRASPVRFECVYQATVRIPGRGGPMGAVDVVMGRVVGVHIAEWALDARGRVDLARVRPIARCGYYEYAVAGGEGTIFEMVIPGADEATLAGLEGSSERVARWKKGNMKRRAKL